MPYPRRILPPFIIPENRTLAMSDFKRPPVVTRRINGKSVVVKPGTRLYVPGMLSDAEQATIDNADMLGIAPLAIVSAGAGLVKSVFTKSAAGPNKDAAQAVLPLALAGNLAAVKAIYKRATYMQTRTSAAPWQAALSAIRAQHPEYLAVPGATDGPGLPVPEEWIVNVRPQDVLPMAQRYAFQYKTAVAQQTAAPGQTVAPSIVTPPSSLTPPPVPPPSVVTATPQPQPFSLPSVNVTLPGVQQPTPQVPQVMQAGMGSGKMVLFVGGGLLLFALLSRRP